MGSFRLMTDANRTSDELGLWLCQYFQRFGLELGQVEDVVIGSVAPQVMHTLSRAVQKYVGKTPLVLDEALDPGPALRGVRQRRAPGPRPGGGGHRGHRQIRRAAGGAGLRNGHHPGRGEPGGGVPGRLHHRRGAGVYRRPVPEDRPAAPGGAGEAGHSAEHPPPWGRSRRGRCWAISGPSSTSSATPRRRSASRTPRWWPPGGLSRLVADNTELIDVVDPQLVLDGLRIIYERARR